MSHRQSKREKDNIRGFQQYQKQLVKPDEKGKKRKGDFLSTFFLAKEAPIYSAESPLRAPLQADRPNIVQG